MRIVYLASGAGDMYCGSCLHSNALAKAVLAAGEDAVLMPLYTPLRTDDENVSLPRLAFGGINVYLQQKWSLFRRTPWLVDRWLDRPWLLRWLGRRSSTTHPPALGELTLSMLQGEEGRQSKELDKLIAWLEGELRPQVVHLSNVLLSGVARRIKQRLGVPVVATLSGEDQFLESLSEPYRGQAREVLRERAADLTALVALNEYYAGFMAGYLGIDRKRVHVIRPGLSLPELAEPAGRMVSDRGSRTIGYLARIAPEKGLHLLAEALEILASERRLPEVRLVAAGYLPPSGKPYLAGIEQRLRRRGLADRFSYHGELTRQQKHDFLRSLDVMCLPSLYPESKGMPVLEAWAVGTPVVVPDHGAFPELVADTGGGLLFRAHDVRSLADRLAELLMDPQCAARCAAQAQAAIRDRYPPALMAQRTIALYRTLAAEVPIVKRAPEA